MGTRVSLGLVVLCTWMMAGMACAPSPARMPAHSEGGGTARAVASPTAPVRPVPPTTAQAEGTRPDHAVPDKADIDELFEPLCKDGGPGAAVLVAQGGTVLFKAGYGLANLKTRARITPDSLFHLGSVGKQFTALGIMMLHEQGRLDYDDPIGKHLPELARFGTGLTIRHLLHHTSGIADYDADEALHAAIEDKAPFPSNSDLLAVLAHQGKALSAAGTRFRYSNTGYDVLGALIERLSGQTYPAFMQERVFAPVGMKNTFAVPDPRTRGKTMCTSYEMKGSHPTAVLTHPFDHISGSGSVVSTVEDLALYDHALLHGRLVRSTTLDEAFLPGRLNDGTSTSYGFGWEIESQKGRPTIGHSGSWLAFDNQYLRLPRQDLVVFVLMNQEHADPEAGKLAAAVAELFLEQ